MLKTLLEYWPIVGLALQGGVLWFVWTMRQLAKKEVAETVAAAEAKAAAANLVMTAGLNDHEKRLGAAEGQIKEIRGDIDDLPTKADFARLEGEMKGQTRELSALNTGLNRMEMLFLERGVERS